MWIKDVGKQLGQPTRSLLGWLVSKFLKVHNRVVEENAVRLCNIQPGETVLELGHGPGIGLEAAAKLLTAPTGKLIGVDYSEYMHQVLTLTNKMLHLIVVQTSLTLHIISSYYKIIIICVWGLNSKIKNPMLANTHSRFIKLLD